MTPEQKAMVREALAEYQATLTEAFGQIVTRNGRYTNVAVSIKGRRLEFVSATTEARLMSGPIEAATVHRFVNKFWYWERPTDGS